MLLSVVIVAGVLLASILIFGISTLVVRSIGDAHHHENRVLPVLIVFWILTIGGFAAYASLVLFA